MNFQVTRRARSATGRWWPGASRRIGILAPALLLMSLSLAADHRNARPQSSDPGLTAHEWGTFTSVAGADGLAMKWLPLAGPKDLPGFVEHFSTDGFKGGLTGTVRMETPVLYFYSTHDTNLSVHVSISKGLITEWYPHATRVTPTGPDRAVFEATQDTGGSITWDSVRAVPASSDQFPREDRYSRYYAARETSSAPLEVKSPTGDEREKFLFYRGVADFSVPLSARLDRSNRLLVENEGPESIPNAILFERRGEKIGYRATGPIDNTATIEQPELAGSLDSLRSDFESVLISQGLYADEAHAMIETWDDSWFEEGSRLFYIVPKPFLDSVLPLSITPKPAETDRVFVGRIELVTPATEQAVGRAIFSDDRETMQKYDRFLEPILNIMIRKETDPECVTRLTKALESVEIRVIAQTR